MLRDISALSRIPHMGDLPLSAAGPLAEAVEVLEVEAGHTFVREGDSGDSIFLVLDGEVESSTAASGDAHSLGRGGVGTLFGLLSLVDNGPRSVTVRAVTPVRAGVLTRERFQTLTRDHAPLALAFQRAIGAQLARDFRALSGQVQGLLAAENAAAAEARMDEGAEYDVAVLGGGPLGMIYAQWVKRMRPESKVVVLERRETPGYKVGESTLSTTVRALLAMGFTLPQMRRLFGNKAGIRFWWADENAPTPQNECDITDIEETFQIERRVFEMALQRLTRDAGVEIRVGTHVELEDSRIEGAVKVLACTGPGGESYTVTTRILCDATGPAAVLPRHLGLYRKDPSLYDTFQTNSYFAYFRQKQDVPLPRWQQPATRHLCTPQGWVWFITLHSWESADDATIRGMVEDVMDHDSKDDTALPPRHAFQGKHGTKYELITSIGFTAREDRDTARDLPIQQRFQHYVDRYPALKWILDHYELVEAPYREKRRPHAAFLGLVHDSTQVAGDGWVAVGDSAQFSNPLFSPGLNYGTGMSYKAAVDTVKALNAGDFSRSAFADYEKYCAEILEVLLHETDYYYRSWAHPVAFEKALNSKLLWGAIDIVARDEYSEGDAYVFDPLNPKWTGLLAEARAIEKRFEAEGGDPEQFAQDMAALIDPFQRMCIDRARELGIDLHPLYSNFDDDFRRAENKVPERRGPFKAYKCPTCGLWEDDALPACPICGTPNPAPFGGPGEKKKPDGVSGGGGGGGAAATPVRGAVQALVEAAAAPGTPPSRKQFHPLKVARVVEETSQAKSISFDIPPALEPHFHYRPGQFLTLEVEIGGERLRRAYSLSSTPGQDPLPRITVKRVAGGAVSNWLCDSVTAGTTIDVLPPDGRFTAAEGDETLFLFAAGSGITPIFSIARDALANSRRPVRLVHVARSEAECIFRDEVRALKQRYGSRLKLIERIGGREGRIDTRDVQAYCDERTDGLYFMCGPWGFMDTTEEALLDMGVDPDRIHVERFASPKKKASNAMPNVTVTPTATTPAAAAAAVSGIATCVTMDIFGTRCEVPYRVGQTLTEAAAAAGVDAPASCEEGFCGTCLARVEEGSVEMAVDDALSKGQKKRGLILACQARPTTPTLRIAFDG